MKNKIINILLNISLTLTYAFLLFEIFFIYKTQNLAGYFFVDLIYNFGHDRRFILLTVSILIVSIILTIVTKLIYKNFNINKLYYLAIIFFISMIFSNHSALQKKVGMKVA